MEGRAPTAPGKKGCVRNNCLSPGVVAIEMGTFLAATPGFQHLTLRPSHWFVDILAGFGLLVFLASIFVLATLLSGL